MVLPLAGRLLQGKFRFVEPIGRGGMAEVWLARNELVDREVALKLIRPEVLKHEENVARFRSEAKAAGRIGSPNICDILDFSLSPIGPFIVMERLRGVSLGEVLRARKTIQSAQAVMIIREALVGLGAAHRAGIIHRDLKPENVFLHRPEGQDPVIKLMDFGVSKFTDGSAELETEHGVLLGTPEYMAPEQCRGARHADPRTDIWAIGAILYRSLAGVDAFHGESLAATLMLVATGDPKPLTELVPGIDPGLVAVIEKCLAKDPDDRYQTTEELAKALAPFDTEDPLDVWKDLGGLSDALVGIASAPTQIRAPSPSEAVTEPREEIPVRTPAPEPGRSGPPRWAALAGLALLIGGVALAATRLMGDDEGAVAQATTAAEPETPEPDAETGTPPLAAETGAAPEPAPTTAVSDETGATVHSPPPPPPPDDTGGDDEGDGGGGPPPDHVDPEGVLRVEKWVTPTASEKNMDQPSARRHCEKLAADAYLGISSWKLANPSLAKKYIGNKGLKKGRYWTLAAHGGRARAINLPNGKIDSLKVTRRSGRPLCVAKWP
jgi:serine/threonine-protein kinase